MGARRMSTIERPERIDWDRRRLLGATVAALAATELGLPPAASAQSSSTKAPPPVAPGSNSSFRALKQIDAGALSVGYAEDGPPDGPPVVLLHGWPYDIHSYVDVAPVLASAGYRVIVPYLRGYGPTRFLSEETPRNGEQAAVA